MKIIHAIQRYTQNVEPLLGCIKNARFFIQTAILASIVTATLSACGVSYNATIGGTVSGLASGTSVTLLNNGTNATTVSSNGSFSFSQTVGAHGAYNVTISAQPTGQTCTISSGSGSTDAIGSNIINITVTCTTTSATLPVSVSVTGLSSGAQVVVSNNSTDTLTLTGNNSTAAGGAYSQNFTTYLVVGATYNLSISTQPSSQTCTLTGGAGTMTISGMTTTALITCK